MTLEERARNLLQATQKHYPDLNSDTSSVRNFYARSSDVIRDFTIPLRNGKENVKNNNRFSRQNNIFASACHFLVHFYAVFARLRREIA